MMTNNLIGNQKTEQSQNTLLVQKITISISKPSHLLKAIVTIAFTLYSSFVYPKSSNYQVLESQIASDFSQSSILSIAQSSRGLIWFATLNGVVKYDGHKLTEYQSWVDSEGQSNSLNITKILNGNNGEILIATHGSGLLKFNEQSEAFEKVQIKAQNRKGIGERNISDAIVDHEGGIWVGYENGGVTRFNSSDFSLEDFKTASGIRISDISIDKFGNVFATNSIGQIYSLKSSSDTKLVLDNLDFCPNKNIFVEEIHTHSGTEFLIGTRGAGLLRVNLNNKSCKNIDLKDIRPGSTIHTINFIDNKKEYWIGTDQGLYILDHDDKSIHFHKKNSGLMNDEVTSILQTNSDISWIGTYSGLSVIVDSMFELFSAQSDPNIHSIVALDSSPKLGTWIATYNGLFHLDESLDTHISLNTIYPESSVISDRIMSLMVDDDQIWVGSRTQGLHHFIPSQGTTYSYSSTTTPSLSADGISSILKLNTDEILVGTYGGGLNLITINGDITKINLSDDTETSLVNNVIMLFQDSSGTIWVGTEGGLRVLDLESAKLKVPQLNGLTNINQPLIWCMTEATDGYLWFGTLRQGLYYSPPNNLKDMQRTISPYSHLPQNIRTIYAIQIGPQDDLWLSTNFGIIHAPLYLPTTHYRFRHGLQGREFEFGASHKDHKGRIYFGGSNGYNRFDPSEVTLNETVPPMLLTNLNIAGQSPTFNKAIHDITSVELNHKDYYVNFEFSALDYLDPANNIYRYKLLGFDPDWVDIGNRNSATYTNLPAGDYTLHIQGASASGVWNREGISVQIKVNPPPWLSWRAYSLYALLAAFIAWHIKRIYDNYVIRERAIALAHDMQVAADRASDEIQEQLDQQSILVETIHHFNLDQLAYVQRCFERYSDLLPADLADALSNDFNNRIEAFICLENALYYRFEELLADLHAYTESLCSILLRAENQPQGSVALSQISIINLVSTQLIPAQLALPLSIVIYELLSNAIEHAFEQGSRSCFIRISLEECPDLTNHFKLLVQDNGIGMPANISLENPDTEGMRAVVQAIRHLNGTLQIERDSGTKVLALVPIPEPRF